jgi:threonyl-tRNA synthetase
MKKVPYMLIIGQKEVDNKNVSFRRSGSEETITMSCEEFVELLKEDVLNYGQSK